MDGLPVLTAALVSLLIVVGIRVVFNLGFDAGRDRARRELVGLVMADPETLDPDERDVREKMLVELSRV